LSAFETIRTFKKKTLSAFCDPVIERVDSPKQWEGLFYKDGDAGFSPAVRMATECPGSDHHHRLPPPTHKLEKKLVGTRRFKSSAGIIKSGSIFPR
jgi:hypothetical protein